MNKTVTIRFSFEIYSPYSASLVLLLYCTMLCFRNEGEETPRYPRPQALADLLDQYNTINTRMQPFMSQYQQLLRDDPAFPDEVSGMLVQSMLYPGYHLALQCLSTYKI